MVFVRLYLSVKTSSGRFRKFGIYVNNRGSRGSGRGGSLNGLGYGIWRVGGSGRYRRGCGQWVHGVGSGAYENGIEISYVTCYFEDEEWSELSDEVWIKIIEDLVCTKFLENKNIWITRSVSAKKYNENRLISHIIAAVQNTIRHESVLAQGVIGLTNNRSRAQVSDSNRSSASAIIN